MWAWENRGPLLTGSLAPRGIDSLAGDPSRTARLRIQIFVVVFALGRELHGRVAA